MFETRYITKPKIGITERGDAGRNLEWEPAVQSGRVDMAILITKCVTAGFLDAVIRQTRAGARLIVHCGCTGWGATRIETGSPSPEIQLASLKMLIDAGFPLEQCVLRIDPIIPTNEGLDRATRVLDIADRLFSLKNLRVRISVIDDYPHVKERFTKAGLQPIYPGRQFYASPEQFDAVVRLCAEYPEVNFETCAERGLIGSNITASGCVSDKDLAICGIVRTDPVPVNMQKRTGCLCLAGKTELLNHKGRCLSACLYCYWKDPAAAAP